MVGPTEIAGSEFCRPKPKVLLGFVSYGPYHHSRLKACRRLLPEWEVQGWELSSSQTEYGWDHENGDDLNVVTRLPLESVRSYEWLHLVWKSLNRLQPAVCVLAGYAHPGMLAAWLWCRCHGRGVVVMSDSKEDDAPRRPWAEWCKGILLKGYDAALVAGTAHRRYFVRLGFPRERIQSGYDVVDNEAYTMAQPKPVFQKPYFLTISRFVPKKNLPALLKAYHVYVNEVGSANAWGLVICGGGVLWQSLEELIDEWRLRDHVNLTGFLQMKELLPYLSHAKALVHASSQEQWGLVVNEAMAAGIPVIVSRECGCFEDLVQDGINGFGFNASDERSLTKLLVQMHFMPESQRKALGQSGQLRVNATHSLAHFSESFKTCVQMALERHPRRRPDAR